MQGLGPGLPPADRTRVPGEAAGVSRAAGVASNTAPMADSVAGLLRELSASELVRIAAAMETSLGGTQDSAKLFERAVAELAERNPAGALEHLRLLASADPARALTLMSEPALGSIRSALEQMIGQLTVAARIYADKKMADAAQLLETPGRTWQEARPELYVLIAGKLIDAGGLVNYVRSAAVSEILLDATRWAPAVVVEKPGTLSKVSTNGPVRWLWYLWLTGGALAVLMCWWSQSEPAAVGVVWAVGLVLLVFLRVWQSRTK